MKYCLNETEIMELESAFKEQVGEIIGPDQAAENENYNTPRSFVGLNIRQLSVDICPFGIKDKPLKGKKAPSEAKLKRLEKAAQKRELYKNNNSTKIE